MPPPRNAHAQLIQLDWFLWIIEHSLCCWPGDDQSGASCTKLLKVITRPHCCNLCENKNKCLKITFSGTMAEKKTAEELKAVGRLNWEEKQWRHFYLAEVFSWSRVTERHLDLKYRFVICNLPLTRLYSFTSLDPACFWVCFFPFLFSGGGEPEKASRDNPTAHGRVWNHHSKTAGIFTGSIRVGFTTEIRAFCPFVPQQMCGCNVCYRQNPGFMEGF